MPKNNPIFDREDNVDDDDVDEEDDEEDKDDFYSYERNMPSDPSSSGG